MTVTDKEINAALIAFRKLYTMTPITEAIMREILYAANQARRYAHVDEANEISEPMSTAGISEHSYAGRISALERDNKLLSDKIVNLESICTEYPPRVANLAARVDMLGKSYGQLISLVFKIRDHIRLVGNISLSD